MSRHRTVLVLLVVAACALAPSRASAHPADMYAQDQTVTLTPTGLQLDWRILPGPFLADAAWAAADTNRDGLISDNEARVWVAPFVSGLTISLDTHPLKFNDIETVHWPATVDVLRTGEDAVIVKLSFDWPSTPAGRHALGIHNAYLESNSLNWFSLTGSEGAAFDRPAQNNGRLTFDLFIAPGVPSAALTAWTSGTPNLPDFSTSLSKLATKLTGVPSAGSLASSATTGTTAVTSALTGLVKNIQLSPYFLLSAFLLSLALGSLHALTPGHGKALVGAYLVGSQGRTRDAVLLGGIVTLTHTGSVLILGFITLLASHYILPSLIVPWLELASGVLVILFGLNLLFQRMRHPEHSHPHEHSHSHEHVHPHEIHRHDAKPSSLYRAESPSLRLPSQIDGIKPLEREGKTELSASWRLAGRQSAASPQQSKISNQQSKISSRSLLALGVSGGLVPCPDAIAILLVAVALNRVPFGMLLIVAFSLGLAAVLIAIGIAMVRGVSAIQRSSLLSRGDRLARFGLVAPVISAIVVTGLGAGLTFNAWKSFQFSQAVSLATQNRVARVGKPSNAALASGSLLYIASDSSAHDQLFMLPKPGATAVQYTQEPNGITGYSVSPDGGTILYSIFTVDGGSSIWSLQPDSSGAVGAPQKVLDCPNAECDTPVFYPDGGKVAYERLRNSTDTTTIPRFSIWWLDLRSGRTQPVFQDAAFPGTAPQFSPDGKWLSYISTATNTLAAFNLTDGRTLSVPLGSQAAIPETWSPDGTALLFGSAMPASSVSPLSQSAVGPTHIRAFTLENGKVTDLGSGSATDLSAAWSPDGKWIAIDRNVASSDSSGGSANQIWLVHSDGSGGHALLNEAGASYSSMSWSPDGRILLYSRYTLDTSGGVGATGEFDVCSVNIATGQTSVLAPGGDIAQYLP